MQLWSLNFEKTKRRHRCAFFFEKKPVGVTGGHVRALIFALTMNVTLMLILSFSISSLSFADDDVGAELDKAEGMSGGTPLEPTPSEAPSTATPGQKNAPPPTAAGTVETPSAPEAKAIPVSNDPTLEGSASANEAKEKTVEAKGAGEDGGNLAKEEVPAQKVCNCKFEATVPYRDRKPTISGFLGLEVGSYQPVNYTPDFVNNTFANYYSAATLPAGLNFGAKYNTSVGAFGVQVGGTFFTTTNAADQSTLTVIPVIAGILFELNTLFNEPYIVPYALFGEYSGFYTEKAGTFSVKGNSPFSQFYAVGLLFQLDWIDPDAHIDAYEGFGLENTFVYVEGRQYMSSGTGVPDLSTPLQIAGGLKLEF